MSNRNHIIQRVASLISDKIDGDTVHLIDSYLPMALRIACQSIAITKPMHHEKLMERQVLTSALVVTPDASYEYNYMPLDTFTVDYVNEVVIVDGKFHQVDTENTLGTFFRAHPVRSFQSLNLSEPHEVPYYFVEGSKMYFAFPTAVFGTLALMYIYTHTYRSITDFPVELEEHLIAELLKLVSNEVEKQAREKAEV